MNEVLAGLVCGYGLALLSAPLVAVVMLRLRSRVRFLALAVPEQTPVVAVMVVLFGFTFLLWTGLGMVFGLALLGFNDRVTEGGLGSPNLAYTLFTLFWTAVGFAPVALPIRAGRPYVAALAAIFAGVFGWLLPYLAEWGSIASS